MAQEVVVHTWCDVHMTDHGERMEANTISIQVTGRPNFEVDLCDDCSRAYKLSDFIEVAQNYGRKVKATRGKAKPKPQPEEATDSDEASENLVCPFGCTQTIKGYPFTSKRGVSQHIARTHGKQ